MISMVPRSEVTSVSCTNKVTGFSYLDSQYQHLKLAQAENFNPHSKDEADFDEGTAYETERN